MKPIAIQLFSLREEAEKDFVGVLKSVAKMGYKGVELAGLHGMKPGELRKVVEDLGMVVSSNHSPWASKENSSEVIDLAKTLGTGFVMCGFGPDNFKSIDAIEETAEKVNFLCEKSNVAGLSVAIHNHAFEFCKIDGRLAYDVLMELCPNLKSELDVYWAANFGACDPIEQMTKLRARTPLIHIKDGPLVKGEAQVAVGAGKMDIAGIINAADEDVLQWVIVEIDECDTDMTQAVVDSYTYLVENGLAEGNGSA